MRLQRCFFWKDPVSGQVLICLRMQSTGVIFIPCIVFLLFYLEPSPAYNYTDTYDTENIPVVVASLLIADLLRLTHLAECPAMGCYSIHRGQEKE